MNAVRFLIVWKLKHNYAFSKTEVEEYGIKAENLTKRCYVYWPFIELWVKSGYTERGFED